MTDKSKAAAARNLVVLERAVLVERDADGKPSGLTAAGLELTERLAKAGSTQNFIAAKLGMTTAAFKKTIGRTDDESPARLAWERGRAEHEQDIIKQLLTHGRKNVVGLIFYSKAKLGWKENEPATIESNIKLVLPLAMTTEQYYATLGITEPLDTRKIKNITPAPAALPGAPTSGPMAQPPRGLSWAAYHETSTTKESEENVKYKSSPTR